MTLTKLEEATIPNRQSLVHWKRRRGKTLKHNELAIYGAGKQHTIHFSNYIADHYLTETRVDMYFDEEKPIIGIKPDAEGSYKISTNKGNSRYMYKTINVSSLLDALEVKLLQRCRVFWDAENKMLWFEYAKRAVAGV